MARRERVGGHAQTCAVRSCVTHDQRNWGTYVRHTRWAFSHDPVGVPSHASNDTPGSAPGKILTCHVIIGGKLDRLTLVEVSQNKNFRAVQPE
ncbi:unnamed protein product [Colias eurytheme]|nr:unnamed protein product [Colias eurytheme]